MDDQAVVRALKALGDGKRFRMVREIAAAGELSCGQLSGSFSVSQPTISHHLKLLVDAGVLLIRQDGQHHFISVNQALLDELSGLLPGRSPAGQAPRKKTSAGESPASGRQRPAKIQDRRDP